MPDDIKSGSVATNNTGNVRCDGQAELNHNADVGSPGDKAEVALRRWSTPILRCVRIKDLTNGIEGRGTGETRFKRS